MSNNMDDDNDDKDDTKRKSRNLSEKKRRDQFNMLVNELSSMVSANNRKMDKSTVLKSTISFLKNHNEISVRSRAHEIKEDWKPSFLSNEEFTHLILEALDGFIMVFSSSGKVFYASEGITSLLGHLPSDLLNMSIYDIVYEEDQTTLYNILLNPTAVVEPLQTGINCENQIIFSLHMKRGTFNAQETVSYEPVQFVGYFRMESEMDSNATRTNYANDQEGRVIFVGTGRLQTPQLIREMSVLDTKSEFTSRHSLEWKFLFLDHRAPPIIGYLPFEVLGTSGYDYYHFDDLDKVVTCHEALMQKGEGTSCFYRFLTKGQQWIWLQTRFYITYHQWNSKPEFVVCTHRVVSHSDVLKHHRGITMSSEEKENEDFDASGSERKHNVSVPVTGLSPWSKSSRASKFVSNSSSPRPTKQHRHYRHNVGNTSDSTSISADSPNSRYSHVSSFSSRSRARHHNQPLRSSSSQNYHHHSMPSQQMQQPQSSYYQNPMVPMTSQLPHHSRDTQATHQMLAPTTFIETAPFVAAIPVQPVIAAPATFGHPTVIQQIPHSSTHLDYLHASNVILTPAQNQIQDQLQRKHEELQHLIQQQQDELRRVSEQLMIARYGVIPVGVPYSTANSPTVVDNRYMTPNQPNLLQPQSLQMMGHSPTSNANAAYQPLTHHQQHSEQSNSSTDLPPNAASSQEYIQLELTSAPNPQMMMSNVSANVAMPGQSRNSADILQFQMNQEQAQSLFDNSGSERSVITSASLHQN